jgi:hypothetical protein
LEEVLEDEAAGAVEPLEEPPLSEEDEEGVFESTEFLLSLEDPSLFEDEPSPLLCVSGFVFDPAAPPLP